MESLKPGENRFATSNSQREVPEKNNNNENNLGFSNLLKAYHSFPLKPVELEIMQINVGKICNQTCSHCHVDAGPHRKEIMRRETMQQCLDALHKAPSIHTVDLTGGAPEMNPDFLWLVDEISKLGLKTIVRSNLTILVANKKYDLYHGFFAKHKVTVIASLPCYTFENTDKQRGNGVFKKSIEALKRLNNEGYGKDKTGLELHLVYNPVGPSLPPPQESLQSDYKKILYEKYGIVFNNLYTITNLPVSRFLEYLLVSGQYESYMEKLVNAFNPGTINGLMCRNTISVGWDGKLYDCDFNQMLDLQIKDESCGNIAEFNAEKLKNRNIIVNRHCYGCTAGAGSTCQGSIL